MIPVLKLISFELEATQFQTQLHKAVNNLSGQERKCGNKWLEVTAVEVLTIEKL